MRVTFAILLIALSRTSLSYCQAPRKNATAATSTTFASIQPAAVKLNLAFNIANAAGQPLACPTQDNSASCEKPQVQANQDTVGIKYISGYTAQSTDTVTLKACFAPKSQEGRPWRVTKPVLAKSHQCSIVIKKGLKPLGGPTGGVKWMPSVDTPGATYFVRALVMRNASGPGNTVSPTTYAVAYGDSEFFNVKSIDSIPTGMKVASALCMCVGPLMFSIYFVLTYVKKAKD